MQDEQLAQTLYELHWKHCVQPHSGVGVPPWFHMKLGDNTRKWVAFAHELNQLLSDEAHTSPGEGE